jgi:hypothetical protein
VERAPDSGYIIFNIFFRIDSLGNRYHTLNLRFLLKLLHNMIDCPELLEELSCKVCKYN